MHQYYLIAAYLGGTVLALLVAILEFLLAVLTTGRCIQALRIGGNWKAQKDGVNYLVLKQSKQAPSAYFNITLLVCWL